MADKPIDATHVSVGAESEFYYKFDGSVWKYWWRNGWERCAEDKPLYEVRQLPALPREHALCCGTTCDKQAVNRYIKQLEAVAVAAQRASDELRKLLSEVGK